MVVVVVAFYLAEPRPIGRSPVSRRSRGTAGSARRLFRLDEGLSFAHGKKADVRIHVGGDRMYCEPVSRDLRPNGAPLFE